MLACVIASAALSLRGIDSKTIDVLAQELTLDNPVPLGISTLAWESSLPELYDNLLVKQCMLILPLKAGHWDGSLLRCVTGLYKHCCMIW